MTAPAVFKNRISERFACNVNVMACTILESRPARIVDLSMHGAQIRMDNPYDERTRIHLDLDGEFVWADVQWAEIDRMGVKFVSKLPADHRLAQLIENQKARARIAGNRRAISAAGFGRRAA